MCGGMESDCECFDNWPSFELGRRRTMRDGVIEAGTVMTPETHGTGWLIYLSGEEVGGRCLECKTGEDGYVVLFKRWVPDSEELETETKRGMVIARPIAEGAMRIGLGRV